MKSMSFVPLFLAVMTMMLPAHSAAALDLTGLAQPESVLVNEKTGEYYISSSNGDPQSKDNNGFITKADSDGLVVVIRFIEPGKDTESELHAPKGMGLVENRLYVADIDVVRVYDSVTGAPLKVIQMDAFGASALKDIAVTSSGLLYVSDMERNKIFMIHTDDNDRVEIFFEGDDLDGPTGLWADNASGGLIVASHNNGRLMQIDRDRNIEIVKGGGGKLNGVFLDRRGDLYVSSLSEGEIYRIQDRGAGSLSLFQSGLTTPADIAYDPRNHEIMVPLQVENRVISISLTQS